MVYLHRNAIEWEQNFPDKNCVAHRRVGSLCFPKKGIPMIDFFFSSLQLAVARTAFVINLGGSGVFGENIEFVSPNVAVRNVEIALCCLK